MTDIGGNPVHGWEERGFERRVLYDGLRRPAEVWVKEGGTDRFREEMIDGDVAASLARADAYAPKPKPATTEKELVRELDAEGLLNDVGVDLASVPSAKAIAKDLPASIRCLYKCMDFSESLEEALKAAGIQGKRITIDTTGPFVPTNSEHLA